MGPPDSRGIGNIPDRYPPNRVPGSTSAPIPTTPCSSAVLAGGNTQALSGGSMGIRSGPDQVGELPLGGEDCHGADRDIACGPAAVGRTGIQLVETHYLLQHGEASGIGLAEHDVTALAVEPRNLWT